MTETIRLNQGTVYAVESLTFAGWTNGEEAYGGVSYHEYFSSDGAYLGPDVDGVEPLFEATLKISATNRITHWRTVQMDALEIPVASLRINLTDWTVTETKSQRDVTISVDKKLSISGWLTMTHDLDVSEIDLCGEWDIISLHSLLSLAFVSSTGQFAAILVWDGGKIIERLTVDDGTVSIETIER